MHITIAVGFSGPAQNLEHELDLIKSAILYGDSVTLCSHKAWLFRAMEPIEKMTSEEMMALAVRLYPSNPESKYRDSPEIVNLAGEYIKSLLRKRRGLTTAQNIQKQSILHAYREVIANFQKIFSTTGCDKLFRLIKDGHVTLYEFKNLDSAELVKDFVSYVSDALQDGSTYPLLDDGAGNLLSAFSHTNSIALNAIDNDRIKHIQLADNLFHRLPGFESATLDEVIDIRSELSKPLIRFRGGLIEISEKIRSATWDSDFPKEVDILVHSIIEPAILEIDEQMRITPALVRFIQKPADILKHATSRAGVCALIAKFAHLTPITLAAMGATASAIASASQEFFGNRATAAQNQMYFYYRLRQKLS